jgi:sulfate adenylyltransferase subunit 2
MSAFASALEDEAVYVIREAAAQFERPAILFSGGKDSVVVVHLAWRAFAPARPPFPLLHIDTGHNFTEVLRFRDDLAARYGLTLIVRSVQDSIDCGRVVDETGPRASRNSLQTVTLLDAIAELRLDACLGGARRDEEKARAKERIFSVRSDFGEWHPQQQRPELFDMLNGLVAPGEHVRVFPISNWTELDVWRYIEHLALPLPPVYFAHRRQMFWRDGALWPDSPFARRALDEPVVAAQVRFRTVGDMTCTAGIESDAGTAAEVISEILASNLSERSTRLDDRRAEAAMEARKRAGYF